MERLSILSITYFLIVISLSIGSLITGVVEYNESCQTGNSIGFELYKWVIGAGILNFFVACMVLYVVVKICFNSYDLLDLYSDIKNNEYISLLRGISICMSVVELLYSILGGIILYKGSIQCLLQCTPLGIITQIMLAYYWLHILFSVCIALI